MITKINDVSETLVAFKASEEVVADDFKNIVMPEVSKFTEKHDYLNYMLILDTDISNFSIGAWLNDMALGLQELKNWHRVAIVSDNDLIDSATKIFNTVTIGEFKVFKHKDIEEAKKWASQPKIRE